MPARQPFQPDGELDVAGADDVLDFEVGELGVEAEFLDDARVLAASEFAVVLRLRARHDHLARGEDERGRLGLADAHDDRGETLRVVLGVARVQRDGLEVEAAVEVHGRDDVSERC